MTIAMEQPGGVAARRRVLVDALTMCLQRSKVSAHVDASTLRGVLDTASADMWREGEFRLDMVWKILTQQPGLTAAEVAPPLLAFKAFEGELGVAVRLPQALTAIPRNEQVRLREELKLSKEDFAKSIGELQALAKADEVRQTKEQQAVAAERLEKRTEKSVPIQVAPPTNQARKPRLTKGVAAIVMSIALVVCGISVFFAVVPRSEPLSFAEVDSVLKIENGKRGGEAWAGTIADPKWNTLSKDDKKKVAGQLFDWAEGKGAKTLTLLDQAGELRVSASHLGTERTLTVR
jgi:hypothetical protein